MRKGGLEPPSLAAPDSKSGVSAIPPLPRVSVFEATPKPTVFSLVYQEGEPLN